MVWFSNEWDSVMCGGFYVHSKLWGTLIHLEVVVVLAAQVEGKG